jgi:hypothetical protein
MIFTIFLNKQNELPSIMQVGEVKPFPSGAQNIN